MIDSLNSRILCERLGIFGIRDQAAMHQFLDSVVRHKHMNAEVAVDYICQRWEYYLECVPQLSFSYGSAYKWCMSGMWDRPDAWPWKEQQRISGPDPCVGMYRPERIQ